LLFGAVVICSGDLNGQEQSVELFIRSGCVHCERATEFIEELASEERISYIIRNIEEDDIARDRLRFLATKAGIKTLAVPAIFVRGRLFVGFDGEENTGLQIREVLKSGLSGSGPGISTGACSIDTIEECEEARAPSGIRIPLFGEISIRSTGLPAFTIIIGLLDGFNPCAMWVLLLLLSLLVNMQSRVKMLAVAGSFVLVSGIFYFAFMAAWLNFFFLAGVSDAVRYVTGGIAVSFAALNIKDFLAPGAGPSLGIPESAKPGIEARIRAILVAPELWRAVAGAVILAMLVNTIELLCTAGLPAIYTRILMQQGLSPVQHYASLLLYNLAYMADDTVVLLLAVWTMRRFKLQRRGGRVLKLISGTALATLGTLLILRPEWLSFV
jgi:glutaredoxin